MPELKVVTRSRQNLVATAMLAPASGHHLIIVDAKSRQLHILNRETLALLRSVALRDRRGHPLTFARMIESVARRSVLIAFAESELWEMFLAPDAEPVFEGLVHDYRMGEGLRDESILPIRRIALDAPMENLSLEPGSAYLVAAQRVNDGSTRLLRFNLDVRRAVAERRIARMPASLAVVSPPGGKGRRLLVSDREGIRGYSLPGLVPESDIDVSADDCGIAAADDARWLALSDCRGDAPGRVHIVDLITNSPKAILQPLGEMMPGEVISRRPDGSLWFAGYGPAGAVVRYRSGDWCRASELVLPGLKRAWIYP